MNFKSNQSGKRYYGNERIENNIYVDSFFWEEDEEKSVLPVLEYLDKRNKKTYIYLISSRISFYPIGYKDKYYKLWKWFDKEYDVCFNDSFEDEISSNRWKTYVGISRVQQEQLEKAFQILQKYSASSYIILSDEEKLLNHFLNEHKNLYHKNNENQVDFEKLINSLCIDDEIITVITGNNGTSMNLFYRLK